MIYRLGCHKWQNSPPRHSAQVQCTTSFSDNCPLLMMPRPRLKDSKELVGRGLDQAYMYHVPVTCISYYFHWLVQFSIFSGHTDSKSFLSHVLSRAQLATKLHSSGQSQRTWHTCVTDLQRVAELNKKLSALANCTATFLQCQLLLSKVYILQVMSESSGFF